jgi:tRNA (uracil-5-)-methyltransferase TRM9
MSFQSQNVVKQTKDVYNRIASHFSNTRKHSWTELEDLVKYTKDGDKVLDLGCGNGRLYQLFQDLSIDYTGLDLSEELIKIAQKNIPTGKFVVGEMTSLPFADQEFDMIYCIAAFHHLPDEESRLKALGEIKRVLKTGGRAIMTNWNLDSEWGREKVKSGKWKLGDNENDFIIPWKNQQGEVMGERYYHGFEKEELRKLFEKTGFIVEDQYFSVQTKWGDDKGGRNLISVAKK